MLAAARFAGGIYWGAINNSWQGQIPYKHRCVGCLCTNHFSTGRTGNLMREEKGERRGREGASSAQLPELQEDIKHNDPGGKETVRSSDVGTSQDFLLICLFSRCLGCAPSFIAVIFFVRHQSNNAGADTMDQMFPCPCCCSPRPGGPLCAALRLKQNNKEDFTAVVGMGGGAEAEGKQLVCPWPAIISPVGLC